MRTITLTIQAHYIAALEYLLDAGRRVAEQADLPSLIFDRTQNVRESLEVQLARARTIQPQQEKTAHAHRRTKHRTLLLPPPQDGGR